MTSVTDPAFRGAQSSRDPQDTREEALRPDTRTANGLRRLFSPQSVAVIGASASLAKAGGAMLDVLQRGPTTIFPVNPNEREILGMRCYARVADVPAKVDLALITVPAQAVPDVLRDCGDAGVGGAVVCAGGFAEAGSEGAHLQEQARRAASEAGVRVLGPNTSGFLSPVAGLYATFMPDAHQVHAGRLAIVAQSGGVNLASAFLASELGGGVSLSVGIGNAMDVGFVDVLEYLIDDDSTAAVAIHIEGVADGRALVDVVRRLSVAKPVVVLKVGQSDVGDLARSHTGAMAGDWALARAALHDAGAVIADSLSDMVEFGTALATTRLPPAEDPGVGVVTGQAGPGLIIADTLGSAGVRLPDLSPETTAELSQLLPPFTYQRNPVDTGRPGPTFLDVIEATGNDPQIDAMLVYALQESETSEIVRRLSATSNGDRPPTLMVTGGPSEITAEHRAALAPAGIWTMAAPDRAARVMAAMIADARSQFRNQTPLVVAPSVSWGPQEPLAGHGPMDEDAAKTVLEALGIATPPRRVCRTREQAHEALSEFEGPVVVKVLDPAVVHKSAVGGVALGVTTPEELDAALTQTGAAAVEGPPQWLIESQADPGPELIIGGVRDPSFGPAVGLGSGGGHVELGRPPVMRLAPLSGAEASRSVDDLPASVTRQLTQMHRRELASALASVGALLASHPEIREMDINPVRATSQGLVALDAVIILDAKQPGPDRS